MKATEWISEAVTGAIPERGSPVFEDLGIRIPVEETRDKGSTITKRGLVTSE